MQVDFLLTERERAPAIAERDVAHAEHPRVERDARFHVADREHQVVEAFNLHAPTCFSDRLVCATTQDRCAGTRPTASAPAHGGRARSPPRCVRARSAPAPCAPTLRRVASRCPTPNAESGRYRRPKRRPPGWRGRTRTPARAPAPPAASAAIVRSVSDTRIPCRQIPARFYQPCVAGRAGRRLRPPPAPVPRRATARWRSARHPPRR